jgi:hypothetical protein
MYKWISFIGLFAFIACKGPSSLPSNVLDYNDMKSILWDMAQVDEFVGFNIHGVPQKLKSESISLYQKVFILHKVSKDEFVKSYAFYRSHPVQEKILMDSLYQFSTRQRQDRFVPTMVPQKLTKLLRPAPMPIQNMPNDWHQYQIQVNFWYEQNVM